MAAEDPQPDALRGIEMADDEVAAFLEAHGHGVLALADDGDAYGIPVSFGYDGERVFLSLLEFGDESEKLDLLATTDEAALIAYEVEDAFRWSSVVLRGELETVDSDDEIEHMNEVMDDNAWFPNIHPPTAPITGVERYAMAVEGATGRIGPSSRD